MEQTTKTSNGIEVAEDMAVVKLIYLHASREHGNMVVLKEDEQSDKHLVMFVGDAEFAAIAKEKGLLDTPRPLTHEMYLEIVGRTGARIQNVEIHGIKANAYLANVHLSVGEKELAIDARPSDAIALALNRDIPILVKRDLFKREASPLDTADIQEFTKTVKF